MSNDKPIISPRIYMKDGFSSANTTAHLKPVTPKQPEAPKKDFGNEQENKRK